MRGHFRFCSLLMLISVLLLSAISQARSAEPRIAKPKTVLDYFLLLPYEPFFHEIGESQSARKKWLYEKGVGNIIDIKNDYIRMSGDAAQPTMYMALFRYHGRVLVGVYEYGEGGVEMASLHFMRYENGRWKDVTKAMLPVSYNDHYFYRLPRYGTTIRVTRGDPIGEDGGKKVYDLVWIKGRFKVGR
jgi:hypothetical protein